MDKSEMAHYVRDAEKEISDLRRKNKTLTDALSNLEMAVNKSISGISKLDIHEWNALLAESQSALDNTPR